MLYEVTFYCNQIACANLVESDDMWTGKEYYIQEVLHGDESRFIGISELNTEIKPGIPIFRAPEGWKVTV